MYTSNSPGRFDGLGLECSLANRGQCGKKIHFVEMCAAGPSGVANGLCVIVLEWGEDHEVERLQEMGRVRREAERDDIMAVRVFNEGESGM
jgi:hypothetical protein